MNRDEPTLKFRPPSTRKIQSDKKSNSCPARMAIGDTTLFLSSSFQHAAASTYYVSMTSLTDYSQIFLLRKSEAILNLVTTTGASLS
jgi:hypothetical protein